MNRTIMIMAGGTGGHIFPALAVADHLRGRGCHVVWLGSRLGMEASLVPAHGYTMAWIRFSGVRGRRGLAALLLPLQLLAAFVQAARAIFAHRPDAVLGMGGYVSFPGGMMASLFNRPLAIHEQNSVAGLANRVLSRVADRVLAAFPGAFAASRPVIVTGNPVRADIAALPPPDERYAARSGPLSLLVLGGSQGAQVLNTIVPEALALMPAPSRPQVVHQAGRTRDEAVSRHYRERGVEAEVVPFLDDMAGRYASADVILCRAGASTIAELSAVGVASVLVPYPHAADDHQSANARFLADRGAARVIAQSELTAQGLADVLAGYTRERALEMARAARAAGRPDAARAVAEVCLELAGA